MTKYYGKLDHELPKSCKLLSICTDGSIRKHPIESLIRTSASPETSKSRAFAAATTTLSPPRKHPFLQKNLPKLFNTVNGTLASILSIMFKGHNTWTKLRGKLHIIIFNQSMWLRKT